MAQTYKQIIDNIKPELDKTIKFFEGELQKARTSHASPALIEDIEVNCFGSVFPLKQLGAISSPQSNQLVIQPWDKSYMEPIQNAIEKSGLGMSAVVDKNIMRLNLPMLTEEYRTALMKGINDKAEQARRTIRHWRETAWEALQEGFKAKTVTEDDKFRGKDELQKIIDQYGEKIKALVEKKRQDIM